MKDAIKLKDVKIDVTVSAIVRTIGTIRIKASGGDPLYPACVKISF